MRNAAWKNATVWFTAVLGPLILRDYAQAAEPPAGRQLVSGVSAETTSIASSLPAFVGDEVVKRLHQIKPRDDRRFYYKVTAAKSVESLPGNLCLDLVYKIGHHQWALVALRFERREACPEVAVSEVTYRSAFGFVKEFLRSIEGHRPDEDGKTQSGETIPPAKRFPHHDSYCVRRGTMPTSMFDHLLLRGLGLWRSSITGVYVNGTPKGLSTLLSSGDGIILFGLSERSPTGRMILKGEGSLIVGDMAPRIAGGPANYQSVRAQLFWEGFHEYLDQHPLTDAISSDEAVPMLVSRLKEPRLADGYEDFFRRSLYVTVLGELGLPEAIHALHEAAREPGIDASWDASLRRDVAEALAKIEILSAKEPTDELIRVLLTPDHSLSGWAMERIEQLPEDQRTRALRQITEQRAGKAGRE